MIASQLAGCKTLLALPLVGLILAFKFQDMLLDTSAVTNAPRIPLTLAPVTLRHIVVSGLGHYIHTLYFSSRVPRPSPAYHSGPILYTSASTDVKKAADSLYFVSPFVLQWNM